MLAFVGLEMRDPKEVDPSVSLVPKHEQSRTG